MSTQVKFAMPGTVAVPRGVSLLAFAYDAVRDLGRHLSRRAAARREAETLAQLRAELAYQQRREATRAEHGRSDSYAEDLRAAIARIEAGAGR